MHHIILPLVLAASLALSSPAIASGHGGSHSSGSHSRGSHSKTSHSSQAKPSTPKSRHSKRHATHHNGNYAQGAQRNSHGKIARSQHAKNDFKKSYPCPSTGKSSGACPGYVIDHVEPLKRGGADAPSNMQWQTKEDAKKKDKVE